MGARTEKHRGPRKVGSAHDAPCAHFLSPTWVRCLGRWKSLRIAEIQGGACPRSTCRAPAANNCTEAYRDLRSFFPGSPLAFREKRRTRKTDCWEWATGIGDCPIILLRKNGARGKSPYLHILLS